MTQVSWSWLQDYVNHKLARTPRQIKVSGKPLAKLVIECDEMWSFVNRKKNEVYIWLAIDRNSRKIVGCYLGDRTRKSARKLWASLPEVYQRCAFAYTDFWQAYKTVIPHNRHRAVGKETGLTNHVERLNNTFRQRVSRAGKSKPIILQKAEQSHWGDLVLHSWLQCRAGQDLSLTTTSISLPTSQVAESHIESIINTRHNKSGKMQWTRSGAHKVLQIRGKIASNEWCNQLQEPILFALGVVA